ncbi:MAG: glycosyltransferase family 2 protein [Actinobacteria bacterium]|nr:glycosyltransferase family 2 protein [Actinomycetota bacterium]
MDPFDEAPEEEFFGDSDEPPGDVPSVVAVLITSGPDDDFEGVLASLGAQDYPALTVLIVDAGAPDDPTARVGRVLPDAYIRRLSRQTTFGAAANEALAAVEGANYLLFLSDDVVLDADAVGIMVEEAVRSNAGVVGPKVVDAERRDLLLAVGLTADKLGVAAGRVDPGEMDHEQHDGVRDVLAVPAEAMLVRADLWAELGGFEPAFGDEVAEVDLCWRARVAGGRVLVVPDAVVARPRAALHERFGPDPDSARALEPAHRLQMLLRNYSGFSLVRVLPQALAMTIVQALGLLAFGRPRRAFSVLRAWPRTLRRLGETLRARRAVQGTRAIDDSEVRSLQMRGFTYVRVFLGGQLHLGMRMESFSGASRDLAQSVTGGIRRPSLTFGAALSIVALVGARNLITSHVPSVGSFLPWPSPGEAFREFGSAWRFVGVGSGGPAPPALALMGFLSAALTGSAALARTVVIVTAIPLGAYGAFRLMLPLARSVGPPLAAATAYAVVPVPRNAIAEGRLGPLVFYAAAPFMLDRLLTAAGIDPFAHLPDGRPVRDPRRALLALALLTSLTAAVFPAAVVFLLLVALALLAAVPLAGARAAGARGVIVALTAAGLAVALLFPWSVGLLLPVPDLGALGFAFREAPRLGDLLVFDTGPAWLGIPWLLLALAAHPLLVASGPRLRWVARGWVLAMMGWAAAWVPGRVGLDIGVPPVEGALVLSALGVAMAVGLGSGVLGEELRRTGLSWRQGLSVVAAAGLVVSSAPFWVDSLHGRWKLPGRDWATDLQWMTSEAADGGFRVLWAGDPQILPLDPRPLADGTGFGITRDGPGDGMDLWPPPAEGAAGHVRSALEAVIDGRTERLGHMVGPLAVRFIAVPLAVGPGRFHAREARPGEEPLVAPLLAGLSRQLDLAELNVDPGLVLFENQAWVPAGALVSGESAATLREGDRGATLRTDLDVLRPVGGYPRAPAVEVPGDKKDFVDGTLLLGEAYDEDWRATAGGALRPHFRALGLTNGFMADDVDDVRITHRGQMLRYGALGVETVVWALIISAWIRRRRIERRELLAWRVALRDVRPGAPRILEEVPV